jgi:hypothetical protein
MSYNIQRGSYLYGVVIFEVITDRNLPTGRIDDEYDEPRCLDGVFSITDICLKKSLPVQIFSTAGILE